MQLPYLAFVFAFAAAAAHAQTGQVPASATDALARDMASLEAAVRSIQRAQASTAAETAQQGNLAIDKLTVTEATFVKAGADAGAVSIAKFPKGKIFDVVDKVGPWYAVDLEKPVQGYKAGWINAASVIPSPKQIIDSVADSAERAFKQLADRAIKMRDDYKDNQYFSVSGFSIATTPPSITVNFEFKK